MFNACKRILITPLQVMHTLLLISGTIISQQGWPP